ncbi:MFS transporter [Nisaea sediminum]|uniref:MFS transporter n=1 Tax=Nisaea sediminum TaxID=2775867 RepID=UPI0018677E51|nr:MFS transporter [Nisaea sediminum]
MRLDPPIAMLAVAETIVWAGLYYIFPALLVHWEADLGWSKTELTGAFTASITVSALCSPYIGKLIDRGYGAKVLTGSTLIGGILIASLSLVDSLPVFYAVWCGLGAAMSACLYEPCFMLVTRTRGVSAKRGITLITLVAGFAGTVSFPSAHALVAFADWRFAVQVSGAAVCLVGLPLMFAGAKALEAGRLHHVPETPKPATDGSAPAKPAHFLSNPSFWLLAVGFALMAISHGVVINHLLPLLKERGVEAGLAVAAASMIGPMQVLGRVVMMSVERFVSNFAAMIYCFLAVSVACALLAAGSSLWLLAGFVFLQGSGYGLTSIMRPVVTREIMGQENFGAISGAMALPYLACFAGAPFLGSLLWEIGGYDFALETVVGTSILGLLCYLRAATRGRHTA